MHKQSKWWENARDHFSEENWHLKVLLWCSQTFAVVYINFCCSVHKLLLWRSQTFAVPFTNFCSGVHKPLQWTPDLYFGWFKNMFAHLKLKSVNLS